MRSSGGGPLSHVLVREARAEEFDRIGELIVGAYDSIAGSVTDPEYNETLRRVHERADAVPVLVAVGPTGDVIGSLTYVPGPGPFAELARPGEAEIRMFAVAPDARGAGVGGALLDAAINRAIETKRRAIVLSTSSWMSAAQRLYRTRGFERDVALDRFDDSSGTRFELFAYRFAFGG
ncbi:MAG: GNAT family N-acetyltransferase [Actinobacteria bacterium]|nr:GNAT family N-acetyltransferase [Actinomycetota bacterium]